MAALAVVLFTSCPGTESPEQEEVFLPPSKPQAPLLVFWNSMIIAGWSGISGADSYEIYCSADSENPGPAVKSAGVTSAVLTATGDKNLFSSGVAYYVWIRAKNSAGVSPLSDAAAQISTGDGPLYRDMAAVDGKPVSGNGAYAIKVTVPPGYMYGGTEQIKKGVFVQGRNLSIDSFTMAKYETTRELYVVVQAWALENGYHFATVVPVFSVNDQARPVTGISWRDAVVWCNAYSEMTGLEPVYYYPAVEPGAVLRDSGNPAACNGAVMDKGKTGYRLPTEVEREFAARGGDPDKADWQYSYAGSNAADDVAWYHGNSAFQIQPVGGKTANRLGIFDLSGNVQEWCWDWMNWAVDVTAETPADGAAYSQTAPLANQKAFNGGGVGSNITYSCVAYRWGYAPEYHDNYIGFRVVRIP
ncbi:MAG: formylglycine-generating enzyme family protein [Treponema sp.]|jgi:formylglycine-generating enzyme required for sulfatase activity|nr:formylglycine-generating enzyme family protein [Treponema sp.]